MFDESFADCMREVDAAIDRLRSRGATAIVVGGTSQGAVAAIDYGATHAGLAGGIGIVLLHGKTGVPGLPRRIFA